MAKFFGKIGFFTTNEVKPGVWKKQIVEKEYYGDVIRRNRRLQSSENLNDNIIFSEEISVVADPFAYDSFASILYVTYMGTKWKVSNVEIEYPRLKLSLGGVYNDDINGTTTP